MWEDGHGHGQACSDVAYGFQGYWGTNVNDFFTFPYAEETMLYY